MILKKKNFLKPFLVLVGIMIFQIACSQNWQIVSKKPVTATITRIREDANPNFWLEITYENVKSEIYAVGRYKIGSKINACLITIQSEIDGQTRQKLVYCESLSKYEWKPLFKSKLFREDLENN